MREYTGCPKSREQNVAWHITSFLVRFSLNFLLHISLNYIFALYVAMDELNSKQSQISRSLIKFQGKNSHIQGVSSALEMTFQIPALSRSSRTCSSLALYRVYTVA